MGSEITFIARNIDLDGFLAALQADAESRDDLTVEVREVRHEGQTDYLWGAKLSGKSEEIWTEAQEEADRGEGTIETIAPADGSTPFDAIIFEGPYRDQVLGSLRATGDPTFDYATTFTLIDITAGDTTLKMGFDHSTRASGRPHPRAAQEPLRIWTSGGWQGRDHESTAADHMAVIAILDILDQYCELEVIDSTEYYHHRIEPFLVAAMAADREMRSDLRAALAAYYGTAPAIDPEPPLTIARLLGGPDQV